MNYDQWTTNVIQSELEKFSTKEISDFRNFTNQPDHHIDTCIPILPICEERLMQLMLYPLSFYNIYGVNTGILTEVPEDNSGTPREFVTYTYRTMRIGSTPNKVYCSFREQPRIDITIATKYNKTREIYVQ